jgi:DNA-binding CsgD family transcriptional regulator
MREAAAILRVTARTIAFHKYRAMKKLGVKSSAELIRVAVTERLVS